LTQKAKKKFAFHPGIPVAVYEIRDPLWVLW
jgi:hypothetical protein